MVTPKLENPLSEYDGNIMEYQDDWNENNSDELLEKSIENLSDIAERVSNPEENSLEYENFIADDSTMEIRDESLSLEYLEVQQKKKECVNVGWRGKQHLSRNAEMASDRWCQIKIGIGKRSIGRLLKSDLEARRGSILWMGS